MQIKLSKFNGIEWDGLIPLEAIRLYKPNPLTYQHVCDVMGIKPEELMMVTANKDFGDLEASASIGCRAKMIERGNITDVISEMTD